MELLHAFFQKIPMAALFLSLAIGYWVTPWAFLFTAFIGVNLIQSSFTKWCLMEDILKGTGIHKEPARQR